MDGAQEEELLKNKLCDAIKNRGLTAIRSLIGTGVDFNTKAEGGSTALGLASFAGDIDTVKDLINAGANVDIANSIGYTALIFAAFHGHQNILNTLIKAGANVNAKTKAGHTALILATLNNHKDVVKTLLNAGADIYIKNQEGETALAIAESRGHQNIIQFIRGQQQLQKKLTDGAEANDLESLQSAIVAGANVNAQDQEGDTALIIAASTGHKNIVQALLKAGANADIKNNQNDTAESIAQEFNHEDIFQIIQNHRSLQQKEVEQATEITPQSTTSSSVTTSATTQNKIDSPSETRQLDKKLRKLPQIPVHTKANRDQAMQQEVELPKKEMKPQNTSNLSESSNQNQRAGGIKK